MGFDTSLLLFFFNSCSDALWVTVNNATLSRRNEIKRILALKIFSSHV